MSLEVFPVKATKKQGKLYSNMGVDLKALIIRKKTNLESLSSKIIAIDAYNAIYQFLAIIRGPEGLHLTDSKGRVTSHLTGLL